MTLQSSNAEPEQQLDQLYDTGHVTSVDEASLDKPKGSEDDHFKDDPDDVACYWPPNFHLVMCQRFVRPSCLLLWLCLSSFTQGLVVNGFVNAVLTTLELRYDLSSSESGLIASMYDIGSVLCLVPVTYIGRRYRRSRLISIGLFIMAVGSFVFVIPKFTTGAYSYQSPVSPLCYLSGRTYPDFCTKQTLNNFKFVFWLGQFLHGVGASPLYTLGVAYLDDNLTIQQSGAFLGIYYAMSLIGPAVGYLLGGIFLNIFVEPGVTPSDLNPSNTSLWVGAWWIGFLISGVLALVIVVPMFGFPVSFPGSARIRHERKQESHGNSEAKGSAILMRAEDFIQATKLILLNPTFMFVSLAGAAQLVLLTALSTFGPKILQTLFYFDASSATFTMGLATVPSAAIGVLSGGLLLRFTQLSVRKTMLTCVVVAAGGFLFGLGLLAKCDAQNYAGVNYNYTLTPNKPNRLDASCNSNCNCQESKFMYSPLCGADNVIYYSPCYAGCLTNGTLVDGSRYYANCSCISGAMAAGAANYSAMEGNCRGITCGKKYIFITSMFCFVFSMFFISIPSLQCTMRVIPSKFKDFGLGLQWVILRLLGSIPGPLVLGWLIDRTCSLWTGGCGHRGSCGFYRGYSFWQVIVIFSGLFKALEIVCLALACFLYVPPEEAATTDASELREKSHD